MCTVFKIPMSSCLGFKVGLAPIACVSGSIAGMSLIGP